MQVDTLPVVMKLLEDAERSISQIVGSRITLTMKIHGDTLTQEEYKRMLLQKLVCEEFNISWSAVLTGRRTIPNIDPKTVYCWLVNQLCKTKPKLIGIDIKRDRTTALHHIQKAANLISVGDAIAVKIENIIRRFYDNIH